MSIVNVFYQIGCFGDGEERSIVQNFVWNAINSKGDRIMFTRKQVIPFRSFVDESYKNSERQVKKNNSISPFAFLHMSDQMIGTYIAVGAIGSVLIGAVLLEKYLVRKDYITEAKFISDVIFHGTRISGICLIGYFLIRTIIMF